MGTDDVSHYIDGGRDATAAILTTTASKDGGRDATAAMIDHREFMIDGQDYDEDILLAQAISASLETVKDSSRHVDTKEEIRAKRLAALDRRGK